MTTATDELEKLVNRWPASKIDELLPYAAFRIMPRRYAFLATGEHDRRGMSA